MKYLHTMVRVADLDASLDFYCKHLGLEELRRRDSEQGRFTLVFLAAPGNDSAQVELTHNWDPELYTGGRNFGHLAYLVDDIYALCERLQAAGVVINRPPRDGHMAFVRSPDGISIELLQKGDALPPKEPWSVDARTPGSGSVGARWISEADANAKFGKLLLDVVPLRRKCGIEPRLKGDHLRTGGRIGEILGFGELPAPLGGAQPAQLDGLL